MISQTMVGLGKKRSVIREIFEYSKVRAAEIGAENIFDFSIGNPSVPPPQIISDTLKELLDQEDSVSLHGYTSAQGDPATRKAIADDLNRRYGTDFTANNFYMTVGAAASLSICFKALALPEDEFIVFAPYFTEYRVFVEAAGGTLVEVPPREPDFQIDFDAFSAAVSEHTKAVIVNSPNNPSGVVYSESTVKELCRILEEKSAQYGHTIYLISDEPYRELVYDDNIVVPFLTKYYKNTLVCYSYSKSLSLPGERIGYVLVPSEIDDFEDMYAAVCGAGRALGYVCAPSLFQSIAKTAISFTTD